MSLDSRIGFVIRVLPKEENSINQIKNKIEEYFSQFDKYTKIRASINYEIVLNAAKLMFDNTLLIVLSGYKFNLDNIKEFIDKISEVAIVEVSLTKDSFEFYPER